MRKTIILMTALIAAFICFSAGASLKPESPPGEDLVEVFEKAQTAAAPAEFAKASLKNAAAASVENFEPVGAITWPLHIETAQIRDAAKAAARKIEFSAHKDKIHLILRQRQKFEPDENNYTAPNLTFTGFGHEAKARANI